VRRRSFLSGVGGALLAACNKAVRPSATTAEPSSVAPPSADIALLERALASEVSIGLLYEQELTSPTIDAPTRARLESFRAHHRDHADAFRRALVLAGRPAAEVSPSPVPDVSSRQDPLPALSAAEDQQAKAHLAAAGRLSTGELAQAIAGVCGVEARHAAVLRSLAGEAPIPSPFLDRQ